MSSLTDLTMLEAAAGLKRGDFSSVELTRACLERMDSLDPQLRAFLTQTPELAIHQAEAADRRLRSEENPLPLLGIPLAVKDVLSVAGVRCTSGSRILDNYIPPFNATAVARLLDAGVVILGKTNADEFAMGSSTENSAYGETRNPWDLSRVPGGSSGGSAAAVAAHMVPAALGTDTGGSVRQPASFCGVTGIKTTYGRVSRYGLVAYGSSLDTVGALGRDAADAAAMFAIMAGRDPLDATTMDIPVPETNLQSQPDLNGLRVGIPDEYFITGMQPEVEVAVRAAVGMLESLGGDVVPISLPHTEYALPVYYIIAPAEASANLARFDGVRYGPREEGETLWDIYRHTRGTRFGAEVKRRIMLGTYAISAGYYDAFYGQAQKVRTLIRGDFDRAFERVDVIAAPIAPTTAFPIGEHRGDPLAMYLEDVFTLPANLAGVPGLALPAGFDSQGLPIGMQLLGPHFSEGRLFEIGHAYQGVTAWHIQIPAITRQ